MSKERYSKLAPFTLDQKLTIARAATKFFGALENHEVCKVIGRQVAPQQVEPLSGTEFIRYLEKTQVLPDADRYHHRVQELLLQLEASEVLTLEGFGSQVFGGRRYWFMKELTTLQSKGYLWLAPALGADFLHEVYRPFTHQITGTSVKGDVHAGTAMAIAPNWLLTCAHVVNDMAVDETQTLGGKQHRVLRQLAHEKVDVGLLQVDPPVEVLGPLAFRDPMVSETLFTFGYPQVALTADPILVMQRGEVTARDVKLYTGDEVFLFSAIARPGNSGGPILASSGHVLGIVTQHLEATRLEGSTSIMPFYAGISTRTLAAAIQEMEPSIRLPIETYE